LRQISAIVWPVDSCASDPAAREVLPECRYDLWARADGELTTAAIEVEAGLLAYASTGLNKLFLDTSRPRGAKWSSRWYV